MDRLAPMLSILGYDPYSNPPKYGDPDSFVKENTNKVKKDKEHWNEKTSKLLDRNDLDDEQQIAKEQNE
jgi:protein-tyrosine sulfotransferase